MVVLEALAIECGLGAFDFFDVGDGIGGVFTIGREFEIQGVRFLGTGECSPCHWQNEAFAPGAEDALQGRGGLRAKILSDGMLRVSDDE